MEPRLEFVFEARLKLAPRLRLDNPPDGGARLSVPVLEGEFEGPRLRGRVLNHGGEFAHVRSRRRVQFRCALLHAGAGWNADLSAKSRLSTWSAGCDGTFV